MGGGGTLTSWVQEVAPIILGVLKYLRGCVRAFRFSREGRISKAKFWCKITEKMKIGGGCIFSDLLTREMKKGVYLFEDACPWPR
jgi:hypothetical protein